MEVNLPELLKELNQDEQDDIFRMIFVEKLVDRPEDKLVTTDMEDSKYN